MTEKRKQIPPETVAKVKALDLLTYLGRYEPNELVYVSPGVYSTRTHDSLKISNGKWYRWSRGEGGVSALDYLERVKGMSFYDAIVYLDGLMNGVLGRGETARGGGIYADDGRENTTKSSPRANPKERKPFVLPPPNSNNERVMRYLIGRQIHLDVLSACIRNGLIYEDAEHHNAVFVGRDEAGTARYAAKRGTWNDPDNMRAPFKGEAAGSDKRYAFALNAESDSDTLIVTEAAIDALSIASLMRLRGRDWREVHILSLGGVASNTRLRDPPPLPAALAEYLRTHRIRRITLCLDNDDAGRAATLAIISALDEGVYRVRDSPPPHGKDYNDYLLYQVRSRSRQVSHSANRAAFSR